MSWRRLCKRKLITSVQEVMLYCRETFLLAQGALHSPTGGSSAKGREGGALGSVRGKVSWAKRDWREGGDSATSLASVRALGLRRSCVKPGQDGVPGRTELFWVRTGQI